MEIQHAFKIYLEQHARYKNTGKSALKHFDSLAIHTLNNQTQRTSFLLFCTKEESASPSLDYFVFVNDLHHQHQPELQLCLNLASEPPFQDPRIQPSHTHHTGYTFCT